MSGRPTCHLEAVEILELRNSAPLSVYTRRNGIRRPVPGRIDR